MNPVDFVELLNKTFAKKREHFYPQAMAVMIVKQFKNYPPEALERLYEVVCKNWVSEYAPPSLGAMLQMMDKFNDTVSADRAIYPASSKAKAIPESTEEYVDRSKLKDWWRLMERVLKIKDKKERLKLYNLEKERIKNGNSKS
jgi:hypothetical protein